MFKDPPLLLSFKFEEKPACGLNYAIFPLKSFIHLDEMNQQVRIATDDFAEDGTHNIILTARPKTSGVVQAVNFDVKVINLCRTTTFNSNSIPNLDLQRQSSDFG